MEKMTSIIKSTSNIILRSVDYNSVLTRYLKKGFLTADIEIKINKPIDVSEAGLIGDSIEDGIYGLRDKNNTTRIFVSSNHEVYTGKMEKKRCFWCMKDYDTQNYGIPICCKYEQKGNDIEYIFYTEGMTCSLQCSYAFLQKFIGYPLSCSDLLYKDSEKHLKLMFNLNYPDVDISEFKPAPDFRLSKICGGSITDKEFNSGKYKYIRSNNFHISPAKVSYERI